MPKFEFEFTTCWGCWLGAPDSVSIEWHTSLCISPKSSRGASILPFSMMFGFRRSFSTMANKLSKYLEWWKSGFKYESWLIQEAQQGYSLGLGEGLGKNDAFIEVNGKRVSKPRALKSVGLGKTLKSSAIVKVLWKTSTKTHISKMCISTNPI